MILITGATGNFGNATIDFLLAKGARLGTIAAMVSERKQAADLLLKGIIIRLGDAHRYASMVDAFERVNKLLLISGTGFDHQGKFQENVIKAAKEAGVQHLFYTNYGRQKETVSAGNDMEQLIKNSGITYTIFRNQFDTKTLSFDVDQKMSSSNAFTPHRDIAEATAMLLMGEGHENKEYYLSHTGNISCVKSQVPGVVDHEKRW